MAIWWCPGIKSSFWLFKESVGDNQVICCAEVAEKISIVISFPKTPLAYQITISLVADSGIKVSHNDQDVILRSSAHCGLELLIEVFHICHFCNTTPFSDWF